MMEDQAQPDHVQRHSAVLWRVMRLDDHGNQLVLADGLCEHEALAMVREYESGGHKQLYWAERFQRF